MPNREQVEKIKLTLNPVKANILAVFLLPVIAAFYSIPFFLLWPQKFSDVFFLEALPKIRWLGIITPPPAFSAIIVLFLGVAAHELIHGLSWLPFAKGGFKSLKFGFSISALAPYCHCSVPLKVKYYVAGALMPAVILGFIPGIVSILTGNVPLLIFGIIFTISAMGDFMIVRLLRHEHRDSLVQDHPTEAGCYVFRETAE